MTNLAAVTLHPSPDYVATHFRRVALLVAVTFCGFGIVQLIQDARGGKLVATAFGQFLITTLLGMALVLLPLKVLIARWAIVLSPDGSIEILGPKGRTLSVHAGDTLVCELSPSGTMWHLMSQQTSKILRRIPVDAFPDLQRMWQAMQASRLHALMHAPSTGDRIKLLVTDLSSADAKRREQAASALGDMGADGVEALAALQAARRDSSLRVRSRAGWAVETIERHARRAAR